MSMTLEEARDRFRRAARGIAPAPKPEPVAARMRRTVPAAASPAATAAAALHTMPPGVPTPAGRRGGWRHPKYTLTAERDDAILAFSAHKGKKVSDLAATPDGRGFLGWIVRQDFAEWPVAERDELQRLCRAWLGMPIEE